MVRKILVCLDGSEFAEQAIPHVLAQIGQSDVKVFLLHVCRPDISSFAVPISTGSALIPGNLVVDKFSRRANHAKLYLLKLAYELAGRSVPAETVVVEGYGTAESIVEFAEAHGIDLMTMASHGREGFKRFLMGNVAGSVARRTLIPVFVVKPKSAKSSGKRGQSRKKSMPAAGVPRSKIKGAAN